MNETVVLVAAITALSRADSALGLCMKWYRAARGIPALDLARAERMVAANEQAEALATLATNLTAIMGEIGPAANGGSFRESVTRRFDAIDRVQSDRSDQLTRIEDRLARGDVTLTKHGEQIEGLASTVADHSIAIASLKGNGL